MGGTPCYLRKKCMRSNNIEGSHVWGCTVEGRTDYQGVEGSFWEGPALWHSRPSLSLQYRMLPIWDANIRGGDLTHYNASPETGTLTQYWWKSKIAQALGRGIWQYLAKLQMYLIFGPKILLLKIWTMYICLWYEHMHMHIYTYHACIHAYSLSIVMHTKPH